MMEETYLMERIKDQMTFTSQNLSEDLAKAKAGVHRLDYVLPDGVSSGTGYIRQHHQTGEKTPFIGFWQGGQAKYMLITLTKLIM